MKKPRSLVRMLAASLLFFCPAAMGAGPTVKDFALLDHEGKFHRLYYYSDRRAVVLISQGNGCPIIRQEIPDLRRLKRLYEKKKVVFLMINANPQDDRSSLAEEAKEYNIDIPILEDSSQTVAESLHLTRTAEAILIDPSDWTIIYRGAIDDRLDYGTQRQKAKHPYLREAINGLLENKPVATPKTDVKGCLISFENRELPAADTYTKDVAPLLEQHCAICHVTGGVAPWAMSDYNKIKGWGPMIREVIQTKRMPPWHADPHYGEFKEDPSLSPEEARKIIHWIDQGYARGEGEDPLIKTRPVKEKWSLGQPDLIFSLDEEQNIPASGSEFTRTIQADRAVPQDLWVRANEVQPGNSKVVHHALVNLGSSMDAKISLGGYSPGGAPLIWPEDSGIFIPKGSKLVFGIHYIPTGKPEKDLTRVGLYLCKQKPSNVGFFMGVPQPSFKIPAGEKNYKMTGTFLFKEGATLVAMGPHMHKRGKSMRFTAKYPDGSSEILLSVPNYKFAWQRLYMPKKPKEIPAGTEILVEAIYDNSAQNPDNPDPTKDVTRGVLSNEEMFWCRFWCSAKKRPEAQGKP